MSLRYYLLKSVILKGKIKDKIVYKLVPSTEFSEGVWNLSIVSVSYCIVTPLNRQHVKDIFSISCNIVKGQKLSASNEIENYNMPLNTFLIDTNLEKNLTYFAAHWFQINAVSNEVKFSIKNESNEELLFDAHVNLHVMFQKIE